MRWKKSPCPSRSTFFDDVLSLQLYWSPFHPSASVAKEFINRFHGAKFRKNNHDLEAEQHLWWDESRTALFRLHIDDGTKEGYRVSMEVPDGFTYHEFEEMVLRERNQIETDAFRKEVWAESQKPQNEDDEEGGYAQPQLVDVLTDYTSFKPKE